MANKITYSNLNLELNKDVNKFIFNEQEVEVLKYLPFEDKYDLIMITLQNSFEEGIYNELKIDMFFHLYLVYLYTNIEFTDKQKEDPVKMYDILKSSGVLDLVIKNIEEEEYNTLWDTLNIMIKRKLKYTTTLASVVNSVIQDLPKNAQAAADIVKSFDPEKYQEVIEFAKSANGGRPLPENVEELIR